MSILKVILHHWNKTTQSYDNFHPETEVSQVTDWNQGIVNTLASTTLGGLVNTLTSDSLLAKMIQKVLTATGVNYSMGQNGYICFGSLFGGLIIQWGIVNSQTRINLPLSAGILRYTVSIWDNKDSSHFISVSGTNDGYIQIINATGISTGTCFYLAITK